MTVAYADTTALEAFTGADAPTGADRMLERASELLDEKVRRPFDVDTVTSLPTDPDVATAMEQACCAQVEYWSEVGEESDIGGEFDRPIGVGHLTMGHMPPELAPRAKRILRLAGLLDTALGLSTSDQFFATQVG